MHKVSFYTSSPHLTQDDDALSKTFTRTGIETEVGVNFPEPFGGGS